MATVNSRETLKDYCLRRLGHPVIEINIDDDQIEDRIDDALQFYREYHFDGTEEIYLKTQVTPSTLVISGNALTGNANLFTSGDVISGATSGATTKFYNVSTANTLLVYSTSETAFQVGETITGSLSGATDTVTSLTKGSYDNKYFEISDAVIGIKRVLPLFDKTSGISIFDIRYQMIVQDLYNLMSVDMIHYTMVKTHLELINMLLVGQKPIRYNRHMNRLHVDMNWNDSALVGDYLIAECVRILDPDTFTDVYNDMFLKRYATALIKKQWGDNLKKFSGVQLPGGVILNGQQIYDEAIAEIQKIEDEIQIRFELPVDFYTG
jgi:hypothetical protein